MKVLLLTIFNLFILRAAAVDVYEPELFVAAPEGIYRMNTDGSELSFVASAVNATSVDYHHPKRLLFWSDVATHKIYSKDLFDNSSEIITVVEGSDDWEPRAIAVDYIHDKIYVMDQGGLKIDVFELDGSKRIEGIIKNLTKPVNKKNDTWDIVLDPYVGFVFYGENTNIWRATMDFSSVKHITNKPFLSGITIDPIQKSIYEPDGFKLLNERNYDGWTRQWVNAYEHPSDYLRGWAIQARSLSKYHGAYFYLDTRDEYPGLFKLESFNYKLIDKDMAHAWTVRVRNPEFETTYNVPDKVCDQKCTYMCLMSRPENTNIEYSCFDKNGNKITASDSHAWTVRVRNPEFETTYNVPDKVCDQKCTYMCLMSRPENTNVEYSCFDKNGNKITASDSH